MKKIFKKLFIPLIVAIIGIMMIFPGNIFADGSLGLKSAHIDKPASYFSTGENGGLSDPVVWHFICNDLAPSPTNVVTSFTVEFWTGDPAVVPAPGVVSYTINPTSNPTQFHFPASGNVGIYIGTPIGYYVKSATLSFTGPAPASGEVQVSHVCYNTVPQTFTFEVFVTKAISGTGLGTFDFILEKQDPQTPANWNTVATLSGQSAGGPYKFVPATALTAGTYRVSESSNGGATYTEVSLSSMPASASGNNTTSGTFTWGGTSNGSQNVYFLNVKEAPVFEVFVTKAISGTGLGTFDFILEKQDPQTPANWNTVATLSGQSAGGPYKFVPATALTAGTYRVSESSNGGATYTEVSLSSMPASASGNNTTSGTFTWGGTSNGSQNVYFLNVKEAPVFEVFVTKAISGTGLGTFDFILEKQDPQTPANWNTVATLSGQSAGGPYKFVPATALTAGTYRVSESSNGGATYTEVSLSSMPASASGNNTTSGTFTWGGTSNGSQNVYFLNVKEAPRVGSITVIKRDITDDAVLAGAVFGLFYDEAGTIGALDAIGNPVGNQTSGADGKAIFTNLLPGTYWVKELTPPTGYGLSGAIQVILGLTGVGSGGPSSLAALINVGPVVNPLDVTIDYRDPRLDGFLRIRKTDSVTGLPVPGATYVVLAGSPTGPVIYRAVTGPDGTITLTGFVWGAAYYVKEEVAPAGYTLDPDTYGPAIFGPTVLSYTFTVTNDPTGGGGKLTVSGITEGIQVLAFTGMDPFIPIAGGSALIAGIAMLVVTLRRRNSNLVKSVSQKIGE